MEGSHTEPERNNIGEAKGRKGCDEKDAAQSCSQSRKRTCRNESAASLPETPSSVPSRLPSPNAPRCERSKWHVRMTGVRTRGSSQARGIYNLQRVSSRKTSEASNDSKYIPWRLPQGLGISCCFCAATTQWRHRGFRSLDSTGVVLRMLERLAVAN